MTLSTFKGTDTYLASTALQDAVNVAVALEKPLLIKGEMPLVPTRKRGKTLKPPSKELDRAFREIAWEAVINNPLSDVTDKNGNGIGDQLED